MGILRKIVRLSGAKVPLDKLPLPEPLYFWGTEAEQGPVILTGAEVNVLPLFSSEELANEWFAKHLAGHRQVGGPDDGAEKAFVGGRLDTIHDLKTICEMARASSYAATDLIIDPPDRDVRFKSAKMEGFIAYALEQSERLYFDGEIKRLDGSVIKVR